MENKHIMTSSIGGGSIFAIIIIWSINYSILWSLIHELFEWAYAVIYFS